MRNKNKGYSFIELIITMAIFSIIMLAIILMMRTSLISYKEGLFETSMQEEAQIAANQVSDLLVDASYIKSYLDASNGGTLDNESYEFVGPEGEFKLLHTTEYDSDGNYLGGKLWYIRGGNSQLLSNQMRTFYIDGLQKRGSASDKDIKDNVATIVVGIEYQNKKYSATKDVYFRNNVENKVAEDDSSDDNYDPFSVEGAPDSISGGGTNPNQESEKILRYHVTDMSAKYDIVADAKLYENNTLISGTSGVYNGTYFVMKELANTMITHDAPAGLDIKRYTVEVAATPLSVLSMNTPENSPKYYIEGKTSTGATKKVQIQLDPVSIGPANKVGVYVSKSNGGEITDTGSPTHINVKGIHINDAVKGGISVSYNAKFVNETGNVDTYSNRVVKYNANNKAYVKEIKPQEGKPSEGKDGPDDGTGFPFMIAPDPIDGGMEISTGNGMGNNKDSYKFLWEGGHKNDLKITFKISGTAQPELTYHFIFTGMSLEPYN